MDKSQTEREHRLLKAGREEMLHRIMKAEKTGKVGELPYQNYLMRQVVEDLAGQIKVDCKRGGGAGAYKKFATYLGGLDPKIASLRAVQAVLGVLMAKGAADIPQPVYKLCAQAAGGAVYEEYLMRHFKEINPQIFNSLKREYDKAMTRDEKHLVSAFTAKYAKEGIEYPIWTFGDKEMVGNYIMHQLVEFSFLESWTRTTRVKGKAAAERWTCLAKDLRAASLEIVAMVAEAPRVAGPLIEPPRDWNPESNGGGGYHSTEMQRLMPYAMQHIGPKPIHANITSTLNILQRRQWQINAEVFDVVRATALKRDFGDCVSPDPGPYPAFPEGEITEQEKKIWKGKAREWYTSKKVRAVKHQRLQRVFADAQELRGYPTIWFAWYADFRTRFYCRSQSVSPQGNDLEKGVLRLKTGKGLRDERGAYWFKVHGANKFGLDKEALDDRAKWVDDNHSMLVRVGSDPGNNLEWTEADAPVQFLAWVIEYARWASSPETFVSHLAMGQDGTCNGLQNFSALMLDPIGGRAVNLLDAPKPRDIYADVAEAATKILQSLPPSKYRDAWLAHGLNRKITKRTTMTLPYGCTRFSCSDFINKDYLVPYAPKGFAPEDYGDAANFLSHVIWKALDAVVVKAREVMEWLRGWATHCAKAELPVRWTPPTGQVVTSQYERMQVVSIKSVAFHTRIKLYKPETGKPDARKIANAVAPNFVHSHDASHLCLVVLAADAAGMEPVTIHDEFGVHACDTEDFHRIIREEFVKMYTDNDILNRMQVAVGYPIDPPAKGTLDLALILQSKNFFG